MANMKKQKGMTAIGWLFVIMIVGMFFIVLIRIFPMYKGSFDVSTSLESLTTDPKAQGKPAIVIRKLLMKRLDINMVREVSAQDITISRSREGITVEVDYEVRKPLFGNLYLLMAYNKSVLISQ